MTRNRRFLFASSCLMAALSLACGEEPAPPDSTVWTFDQLDRIGGHPVTAEGDPQVIETPLGPAIQFDGVDDALFLDFNPLAGAEAFTFEAVFRPDGGAEEQRWFHLNGSPDPEGRGDRMLFEIRVVDGQWCLDAFVSSGEASKALLDRSRLYPLGEWHHVAMVYDGQEFRSYVNGQLDGLATIQFAPQSPGRTAVGVRINRVDYFRGAIRQARFTREALPPEEFQRVQ